MEPEASLPHSQQPATCAYPEPYQSRPCHNGMARPQVADGGKTSKYGGTTSKYGGTTSKYGGQR